MKNKVIIITIIIAVLLIGGGVFLSSNVMTSDKNTKKPTNELYNIEEIEQVKSCYNADCTNSVTDVYAKMKYDYDSKKLQEKLDKINSETEKAYKEAKNSKNSGPECPELTGSIVRYNHSYYGYTTDELISIAIKRVKQNLCTFEGESTQVESYMYDYKNDKLLSNEEILKVINYTADDVTYTINTQKAIQAEDNNIEIKYSSKYDDYTIYYDTIGTVNISFYIEELNEYFETNLLKNN